MDQTTKIFLEHNWKYFELHANQRMQMFNFFIVISTTISAGIGAFIKDSAYIGLVLFLCIALTLISFIFWKLDRRTSSLIKNAECSMKKVESEFNEDYAECKIFISEEHKTSSSLTEHNLITQQWTYSRCFNLMFITMGVLGVVGILFCIYQLVL